MFQKYPYYYFYFQRCFYIFIKELLVNLSKKYLTLDEAFWRANEVFANKFKEIKNYIEEEDIINNLNLDNILIIKDDIERKNEIFFNNFEDVINQNFDSSSNNLLNSINAESKNSLEIGLNNSPNLQKELYLNDEKKEMSEDKKKKI